MAIGIKLTDDDLRKSKRPEMEISPDLLRVHRDHSPGIHPKSALDTLALDPQNPTPATYKELRRNFKEFCKSESTLGENFNTGIYIRMDRLKEMIQEFETEGKGGTHLFIGLGLRKSKITEDIHDWNCFHLIFGAATPNIEVETGPTGQNVGKKPTQKSDLWFSTYDGVEQGYTGSKPGCPPFSCSEE